MSAWRFLLDENVDPKTATYLEKEGLYAEHVRDALWLGATTRRTFSRTHASTTSSSSTTTRWPPTGWLRHS
jgi:predicted nuclease of predicted toxin-antitoxin system